MNWPQDHQPHLPLEFRVHDYREAKEVFDHIASIGLLEHVGVKNYAIYMEVTNHCLADAGLFLLHTIGKKSSGQPTRWIDRSIFPNSEQPGMSRIRHALEVSRVNYFVRSASIKMAGR